VRITSPEQAKALNLGAADFETILWENDGRDLVVTLELPTGESGILCFQDFSDLDVAIDFGNVERSPHWSPLFKQTDEGRWHITIGFGGAEDGTVEFECEELVFNDGSEPEAEEAAVEHAEV
jgi:hypothetical protein